MDDRRCPICRRLLSEDPRAKYCAPKCRWRAYWQRSVQAAARVEELPLAVLPADADAILPTGRERTRVMLRLAVLARAPAGSRGYRVGIRYGLSQIQLWFPVARFTDPPMFSLEPFAMPVVPVAGSYAVVYLDRQCKAIGGPRFAVGIDDKDPRLRYSDGDRSFRPSQR